MVWKKENGKAIVTYSEENAVLANFFNSERKVDEDAIEKCETNYLENYTCPVNFSIAKLISAIAVLILNIGMIIAYFAMNRLEESVVVISTLALLCLMCVFGFIMRRVKFPNEKYSMWWILLFILINGGMFAVFVNNHNRCMPMTIFSGSFVLLFLLFSRRRLGSLLIPVVACGGFLLFLVMKRGEDALWGAIWYDIILGVLALFAGGKDIQERKAYRLYKNDR